MSTSQSSVSPAVILDVLDSFFIPPNFDFDSVLHYIKEDFRYSRILVHAVSGLKSVVSTASLPFQLVNTSTLQRKFDRFHSAESILALKHVSRGSGLTDELKKMAYETADLRMSEFMQSSEGEGFFRDEIVSELGRTLRSKDIAAAAQELLAQSIVSTWSVFENFSRSIIVEHLNANPRLAEAVVSSAAMKDFFGRKPISIETIARFGYDLSSAMGDALFEDRRLDSLGLIKPIFREIFDDGKVSIALGDEIWDLNQLRHLFVHRRGLVDRDYLEKSKRAVKLGERLHLKSDDLVISLNAVLRVIFAIASSLSGEEDVETASDPSSR